MQRLSVLFGFLLLTAICPLRAEGGGGAPVAEQQTKAFYIWYLHALNGGENPLTKKRGELARYVSSRMLRRIDRLSRREGGLKVDPFLCVQGWDKAWEKHVSNLGMRQMDGGAAGAIMLDGAEMPKYELEVELVYEQGTWKLDRVEHWIEATDGS